MHQPVGVQTALPESLPAMAAWLGGMSCQHASEGVPRILPGLEHLPSLVPPASRMTPLQQGALAARA